MKLLPREIILKILRMKLMYESYDRLCVQTCKYNTLQEMYDHPLFYIYCRGCKKQSTRRNYCNICWNDVCEKCSHICRECPLICCTYCVDIVDTRLCGICSFIS